MLRSRTSRPCELEVKNTLAALTGSLATGMLSIQALTPIAIIVLLLTARRLKGESEQGRRARA